MKQSELEISEQLTRDNPTFATADQWFQLAQNYFYARNGKGLDYVRIRMCCERALTFNKEHSAALFNLGLIYGFGLGTDKDSTKAHDYHRRANRNESVLILQNPTLITAQQWSDRGDNYYQGRGQVQNYSNAVSCYRIAVALDRTDKYALYSVGWQLQCGQGISKDLVGSRWHYETASQLGHYDSMKQLLILDNPGLTTADQWFQLAQDYFYTKNGKILDYVKIRMYCEVALTFNKEHSSSLSNLGLIYGFGLGIDKDSTKANDYHRRAKSLTSNLILKYPALITAQQWSDLGNDYYGRHGQTQDYGNAVGCYTIAVVLNRSHQFALYSLGWQYQYGQGMSKDLATARWHYETASKLGHYESMKQLLILDHPQLTTADQWFQLAQDYFYARNGRSLDCVKARIYCEIALSFDEKHSFSLFSLGLIYGFGLGTEKDHTKANDYLTRPAIPNHVGSALILKYPDLVTAQRWSDRGDDYYFRGNEQVENYAYAVACHIIAVVLDRNHQHALYSVGWHYQYGLALPKNLGEARWYYDTASQLGHYKSMKQLLILDHPKLTTADQWFQLAQDYFYARNGKVLDYVKIRMCCEIALTFNKEHSSSLFNLGLIYGFGLGTDKDPTKANDYHRRAKISDSDLILKYPDLITAQQWSDRGDDYYQGRNGAQNYTNAVSCYTIAAVLNRSHQFALYSLGWQYQYGQGVTKDSIMALWHYETASKLGHYESMKQLLILDNPKLTTADQWFQLGQNYYLGSNGKLQDHLKARACYELTLSYNREHADGNLNLGAMYYHGNGVVNPDYTEALTYYDRAIANGSAIAYGNKGLLYEGGHGVTRNFVTAAKYFRQAIERGHAGAQGDLNRLHSKSDIPANDSNLIGAMYHTGDGVERAYERALTWYNKAIEGGSAKASRNKGLLYEYGLGVTKNFIEAARCYRQAIQRGLTEARDDLDRLYQTLPKGISRTDLKIFEKERIVWKFRQQPDNFLNEVDHLNDTALHRMAKKGLIKHCARLLFMGASSDIRNRDSNLPLACLPRPQEQQNKIRKLRELLADLISRMDEKAPSILSGRVSVVGGVFNRESVITALNELYEQNEMKPLMDLAKLAALGLHDLAQRRCFEADYDSDDDDVIKLNPTDDKQKLSIQVDASKRTVEGMCYWGKDGGGRDGAEAVGVYFHRENSIYFGGENSTGNKITRTEIRATMIHELTHFLAYEIFQNKCYPYKETDNVNRSLFESITNELKQKYENNPLDLDPILRQVFAYYKANQYHAELIVRVPQMFVQYKKENPDGWMRLQRQAPRLLDYYNNFFLMAVKQHIEKLKQRALSHWPEEMLKHNRREEFALQRLHL